MPHFGEGEGAAVVSLYTAMEVVVVVVVVVVSLRCFAL